MFLNIGSVCPFAQESGTVQFSLSGEIINSKSPAVYLLYTDRKGNDIKDSCTLQNGRFVFKGNIIEPTFAILKANSNVMEDAINKNINTFFLEPTNMTTSIQYDHFSEMILSGSKTQVENAEFEKLHSQINKNYSDLLYERHSKLTERYIIDHPDSYISVYELSKYKSRWSKTKVKYLYEYLIPEIRNSLYGRRIKLFLDELEANSEGKKATNFSALDLSGNTIQLSGFKEKYVLLDFWGSWCVPCRQSTPHLLELYKKYSQKGFTVIGIAEEYDKTGIAWKDAIKKDGVEIWSNILSNPGADNTNHSVKTIAAKNGIHVFPTKLLIDPSGYIIGRFEGRSSEAKLDKLLKEIYN